jgi:GNAT superfamily N-acetyltransferase
MADNASSRDAGDEVFADPDELRNGLWRVDYRLERVLWGGPDEDLLDVWHGTLALGSPPSEFDDDPGPAEVASESDDEADDEPRWHKVATCELFGFDVDRCRLLGEHPFHVADAHSAEMAYYYEHVFAPEGDVLADVAELFVWPPSRVLFVHDVRVAPLRRRHGYASLLLADALLGLAPLGTAVLAHPGPTDVDLDGIDPVARLRSETANTRLLAALGFAPFRDRLWALDLATEPALQALGAIRRG